MAETTTREPWLSARNQRVFLDPLSANNPITVQVLGICSTLAVTAQLKPALIMGIGLTVVVAGCNVVFSLIRNWVPNRVRIIIEMVVAATLVILVDQMLRAMPATYGVSKQLSVFVGLIITNCIVMGRMEAFAIGNPPWPSFLDGVGNGLGYSLILALVGASRELLGSGSVLGYRVVPEAIYHAGYVNNGLLLLAPGAFIVLGVLIWIQRAWTGRTDS